MSNWCSMVALFKDAPLPVFMRFLLVVFWASLVKVLCVSLCRLRTERTQNEICIS